jgi:peptidoglycan/xylan/chitin deacetylase (PgdA/CDA1 family)/UDP-N-acetylglucosamine:LPS N-acetylglucosamine transferase
MRILHLLSQVWVTGAETYAASMADYQIEQGHEVFIISDTFQTPVKAPWFSQPIANRSYLQRWKNIQYVASFIRKHKIEVVHSHSRAASWVAYFACKFTKVPLVSIIHGRQHLHLSTSAFDIYGDKVIAICKNMQEHLIKEVKMKPEKISVIPNGFDFSAYPAHIPTPKQSNKQIISIIGRTNGRKGELTGKIITDVVPQLTDIFPELEIRIIGGKAEGFPADVIDKAAELNKKKEDTIRFVGFVNNIADWILESDLIIGAGRVAIETLFLEKPLLAFGESLYCGRVTSDTFQEAVDANFGDIIDVLPVPDVDFQKIAADITSFFKNPSSVSLRNRTEEYFNLQNGAAAVMEVYKSAIFKKKLPHHIPALMYHKVPDEPQQTKNQIFITKDNLDKHFTFLQKHRFTPLTFKEYNTFRDGQRPLSDFPEKPIFLTFDDAYLDNYTNLFPLLKKYNFKAVIFSLGDEKHTDNFWDVKLGEKSEPLMNTAQKKEMMEYGVEIGGHTLNHPRLTQISVDAAEMEIMQSKLNLEKQLGTEIISFAYPYGDLNEEIKSIVKKAGYSFGIATDSGGLHLEDDLFQIFRVGIFPEDAETQLRKKTASWYRKYFKMKRGK